MKGPLVRFIAKGTLILGGLLTGIVSVYAMETSTLTLREKRRTLRWIADLINLSRREPVSKVLILISLGLLAVGLILYLIGRNME